MPSGKKGSRVKDCRRSVSNKVPYKGKAQLGNKPYIYNNIRGEWEPIEKTSVRKIVQSEPSAEVTKVGDDYVEIYNPTAHPDVRVTRFKNLSKSDTDYFKSMR